MVTDSEARSILDLHHDRLCSAVDNGWDRWCRDIRPKLPWHDGRCRANVMHCLMVDEARRLLAGLDDVRIFKGQRNLFIFAQRLIVQLKLLDKQLRTRNFATASAVAFDEQEPLSEGYLPDMNGLDRLTVGYCLDDTETVLDGRFVVYAIGKRLEWYYELERAATGVVVPHPTIGPLPLPFGGDRLVRAKRAESEDGDSGEADSDER